MMTDTVRIAKIRAAHWSLLDKKMEQEFPDPPAERKAHPGWFLEDCCRCGCEFQRKPGTHRDYCPECAVIEAECLSGSLRNESAGRQSAARKRSTLQNKIRVAREWYLALLRKVGIRWAKMIEIRKAWELRTWDIARSRLDRLADLGLAKCRKVSGQTEWILIPGEPKQGKSQ